ncbi:twin-arginine translocase TatA/TatE family subunit [Methanosarcinales archaeon]|nr:MAG: twin-arginine translocase TatA/TatE family subunit [Methanosarcinales archaeon]
MFGLGPTEIILILAIILLLFGASKVPELARSLGSAMGEFKKAKMEVERELKMGENLAMGTEESESARLRKAAKDLGIDIEGMSDEDIKMLIREKLASQ